jgi:hypothetical protein
LAIARNPKPAFGWSIASALYYYLPSTRALQSAENVGLDFVLKGRGFSRAVNAEKSTRLYSR